MIFLGKYTHLSSQPVYLWSLNLFDPEHFPDVHRFSAGAGLSIENITIEDDGDRVHCTYQRSIWPWLKPVNCSIRRHGAHSFIVDLSRSSGFHLKLHFGLKQSQEGTEISAKVFCQNQKLIRSALKSQVLRTWIKLLVQNSCRKAILEDEQYIGAIGDRYIEKMRRYPHSHSLLMELAAEGSLQGFPISQ